MPATPLRTYGFAVAYLMPSFPEPVVAKAGFEAAYFVEENTLVSFKDTAHAVVRSFKSELVVDIERLDAVDDRAR